jgi:hypothetical protein
MADRAVMAAFVLSLLGAAYQMIAYGLTYLLDNRYNYNYYSGVGGFWIVIAILVVIWAMSHLMDGHGPQRVIWPSIILAMGAANLANMIILWITPVNFGPLATQTVPADVILTSIPGPLLLIAGGIFGFIAVQHQRKISSLGIRPPT